MKLPGGTSSSCRVWATSPGYSNGLVGLTAAKATQSLNVEKYRREENALANPWKAPKVHPEKYMWKSNHLNHTCQSLINPENNSKLGEKRCLLRISIVVISSWMTSLLSKLDEDIIPSDK
jgi:hypothetical protein